LPQRFSLSFFPRRSAFFFPSRPSPLPLFPSFPPHQPNHSKLSLQRNIKCGPCGAIGTKSGQRYPCDACQGTGVQVSLRPLGPGMVQQVQSPCGSCRQTGFATPPSDRCPSCSGRGLVPEKKVFDVHVEPGHKHGSKIVLRGEAGCPDPSVAPGDVVFVLEQKPHDTFKRIGADLVMERSISLAEALTGFTFTVDTLEAGRTIRISHAAGGAVVKPDTWWRVPGEGMPHHGRPFDKGNLYIHFNIAFPDALTPEQVEAVRAALPGGGGAGGGSGAMDTDGGAAAAGTSADHADLEDCKLHAVADIEAELQARRGGGGSGAAYESSDDEDGGRGGQRVQCAQQ
jgi:DnaJ homolog subfamily A member 2